MSSVAAHRIRMLQIVDSLQPGGMENILTQLLSRLDPARYDSRVVCLVRGGPFEERLPPHVPVSILGKPPGFRLETVRKLREVIRAHDASLIHTHHLGGLIYTVLADAFPLRGKTRLIHSEHIIWDEGDLTWKRQWQRRLLYRFADCVFAVSQGQVRQMQALGHHPRGLRAMLNGVNCSRFHPPADGRAAARARLGLPAYGGRWLGMVARFSPAKRHADLIAAFEQAGAAHPDLRLVLVGDGGPAKAAALERFEFSPLRSRMHWAGFQQDTVPWYQAMDALVLPSVSEGLPNAALEAMACGLPLVANDACGVDEVAVSGEHGWIASLRTVPLLAGALERVASADQAALDRMGAAARRHVEAHFSLDAMVRRYDEMFTSVVYPSNPVLRG
jgi:glycosyltransferase involved in cell wall biosynthesis